MTGRGQPEPAQGRGRVGVVDVSGPRLHVDPVACDGVGLCARMAPAVIDLDRWGFPILADRDLRTAEVSAARRAIRACPKRALWLVE